MKQLSFLKMDEPKITTDTQEWGTFKDSLRAPIHNWFTYPAGFSYKAVESSIQTHGIKEGQIIYDPFMGSGTTNLVAKKLAISSYGVEAHPFVFRIAKTKMNWTISNNAIHRALRVVESNIKAQQHSLSQTQVSEFLATEFPELILKCYEHNTLLDLWCIRNAITNSDLPTEIKDFFFVGLTSVLRQVATAATGWPYIAPNKQKVSSLNKNAFVEFTQQIHTMLIDVQETIQETHPNYLKHSHQLFNGDSRYTEHLIPSLCVDHVFTSPPYLNNFDYADRTRLELYFWGEAKNWGDISEQIRTKLITSATTQILRTDAKYNLADDLQTNCPYVFDFLQKSISELSAIRGTRGGKKSYDYLVSGYFNDMFKIISEVYRVLKHNTKAIFVLGDSAPYGIHIPTDELIGKIGLGIGFSDYRIDILRARGGKWKANPQRHNVELRESIVTLTKT